MNSGTASTYTSGRMGEMSPSEGLGTAVADVIKLFRLQFTHWCNKLACFNVIKLFHCSVRSKLSEMKVPKQ